MLPSAWTLRAVLEIDNVDDNFVGGGRTGVAIGNSSGDSDAKALTKGYSGSKVYIGAAASGQRKSHERRITAYRRRSGVVIQLYITNRGGVIEKIPAIDLASRRFNISAARS